MEFALLVRLTNQENMKCPKCIYLRDKKTVLGRKGDIIIDTTRGKEISKKHAAITKVFQHFAYVWVIQDLGSMNGTFVNDRKVLTQTLNSKDEVVFGVPKQVCFGEKVSTSSCECRYRFLLPTPPISFTNCLETTTDLQTYNENDQCSICFSNMIRKQKLPCGHMVCLSCIRRWVISCGQEMKPCLCPICRCPFSKSDIMINDVVVESGIIHVLSIESLLELLQV